MGFGKVGGDMYCSISGESGWKKPSVYDIHLRPPESLFTLYYCPLQQLIADNFSKTQAPAPNLMIL